MDKEDLLKKYFKQTLSEQEQKEFYLLLDTDSDFKVMFEEYSDFNLAFKSHEAEQLKDFLKSIDDQPKIKKTVWYKTPLFYYSAVAILIIALCVPFLMRPSADSLYNDYFDTYPNVEQPIVRGTVKNSAYNAFDLYENNRFVEAAQKFEVILKDTNNSNLRFYYAMSLLNSSQYDLAQIQLSELDQQDFDYKDETLWYLSLILIKKKQTQEAITKLKELDKSNSPFKSKERKLLLQKL
ncbi:hypothetical protein [Winogradskyella sp.]|uniref:tetratricopeptide repeat protein n=1 Tax=Winogradskyella sp. TaxID=1883156 RepID=UPI00260D8759|nr:hypothetical protein [Winogradskyella sp.]